MSYSGGYKPGNGSTSSVVHKPVCRVMGRILFVTQTGNGSVWVEVRDPKRIIIVVKEYPVLCFDVLKVQELV